MTAPNIRFRPARIEGYDVVVDGKVIGQVMRRGTDYGGIRGRNGRRVGMAWSWYARTAEGYRMLAGSWPRRSDAAAALAAEVTS